MMAKSGANECKQDAIQGARAELALFVLKGLIILGLRGKIGGYLGKRHTPEKNTPFAPLTRPLLLVSGKKCDNF